MNDGGVRLDGVEHVQHHRQRLVLHLHPFQRRFRRAPALRGHRHHLFALVAHPVDGQHRLIRERRPVVRRDTRHGGDVRAREHRGHPGAGLGPGLVDADDARVGMGTSEHRHVQQPRRLQVARVQRATRHLLEGVPAINRRTDDGIIRHAFTSRRSGRPRQLPQRSFDEHPGHLALVVRAAAQVRHRGELPVDSIADRVPKLFRAALVMEPVQPGRQQRRFRHAAQTDSKLADVLTIEGQADGRADARPVIGRERAEARVDRPLRRRRPRHPSPPSGSPPAPAPSRTCRGRSP